MKRALVLSLFVVLIAAFMGSAQELKGEWDSYISIDLTQTASFTNLINYYSYLDVQYIISGWTLEAATIIDQNGLGMIWFDAFGTLGAFSAWSLVAFDPVNLAMLTFENAATVSIAGVDLYGLFFMQDAYWLNDWYYGSAHNPTPTPLADFGTGFALGGIGTAGDIRVGVEVTSNLYPSLWFAFLYGVYDSIYGMPAQYCTSSTWYPYWLLDSGTTAVIQTGCDTVFSYITAVAEFPICCADIYVMTQFSCSGGFDFLSFLAKNIDLGIDWVNIYELGITYTLDAKSIGFSFKVVTGDVVCFTPYFDVVMDGETILDGVQLNALTLSCTVGGCEFFWGHIFDHYMTRYAGWEWPTSPGGAGTGPYSDDYYFDAVGGGIIRFPIDCAFGIAGEIKKVCVSKTYGTETTYVTLYPNEVFGVQCDEDSCCGGLFSFSLNNFFYTGDAGQLYNTVVPATGYGCITTLVDATAGAYTGIFGWFGSYIELSAGIGSNVSLITGLKVSAHNGTESVKVGFSVAW